jgi:phosphoglycerate dehydrogenase-like enzyme
MTLSTIWTNTLLTDHARELLSEATKSHRLIIAEPPKNVLAVGAPDPSLREAEIVFGQPSPDLLSQSKKLRWVHLSSAGYTRYDTKEFRDALRANGAVMTNSSSIFDKPCAEHVMAWLLADSHQFYPAYDNQRDAQEWAQNQLRKNIRLLADQTILIVGYGAIGRRLTELLAPYPVTIIGYRRTHQPNSPISVISPDELPAALAKTDHVINILPESDTTIRFFDAARFMQIKLGSRYYSIGRGSTTDQEALRQTLDSGHLSAAYLDVTDPEPLPPDHFLWRTRNCFITPHMSGGHVNESIRIIQHFIDNLARYDRQTLLLDQVF